MPIRVALDAMGGDFAPVETIQGAVAAANSNLEISLYGDPDRIAAELAKLPTSPYVRVVATSQEVAMGENPVEAFRKKPDSSLRRAVEAVRSGAAQAMVTAGNTGAAMTAGFLTLGAVEGIQRPAIAITLPTTAGPALLIDAGANVDCSVENLFQFALMGVIYVHAAWGLSSPTVGLLNIGEESSKGNILTKQAHDRLQNSSLNFVGNVEARGLYAGAASVVVCDGFVGNVLLKASEGVAEMIGSAMQELAPEIGADTVRLVRQKLRRKMDYAVYGGAPLLGLNGACFIAHGRSNAQAITSALQMAEQSVASDFVIQIQARMKESHG